MHERHVFVKVKHHLEENNAVEFSVGSQQKNNQVECAYPIVQVQKLKDRLDNTPMPDKLKRVRRANEAASNIVMVVYRTHLKVRYIVIS